MYLNKDKSIQIYYNWTVSSVVFYDFEINQFVAACAQTMDYQLCQTWVFRDSETNMVRLSTNVRLKPYQFNTNMDNNSATNSTFIPTISKRNTNIIKVINETLNTYVVSAFVIMIMLALCGCCCYYKGLRNANQEIKSAVESELKSFLKR